MEQVIMSIVGGLEVMSRTINFHSLQLAGIWVALSALTIAAVFKK